jgi:hypothetical protein
MRMEFVATLSAVLAGCLAASSPAFAQQKTVKECQSAWQADKPGNQAKGITEKAYVDQCRAGAGSAATPTGRDSGRSQACADSSGARRASLQACCGTAGGQAGSSGGNDSCRRQPVLDGSASQDPLSR